MRLSVISIAVCLPLSSAGAQYSSAEWRNRAVRVTADRCATVGWQNKCIGVGDFRSDTLFLRGPNYETEFPAAEILKLEYRNGSYSRRRNASIGLAIGIGGGLVYGIISAAGATSKIVCNPVTEFCSRPSDIARANERFRRAAKVTVSLGTLGLLSGALIRGSSWNTEWSANP